MSLKAKLNIKVLLGYLCIFGSAFFFYLATVVIKWTMINGFEINTTIFVFARFVLGFISVLILIGVKKKKIQIKKMRYLIGRTISNCIAVYCFFKGVELTSVSQANILNMTYPVFIALFSWFFFKTQRDIIVILIVAMAFAGVWLILTPVSNSIITSEETGFHLNSMWALASGLAAAIAIMCLNLSRQEHDIETILFFLFGLGSIIILIVFFNQMTMLQANEWKYIISCSFFSIIGQYLLTMGFKYVTAIEGGIISSTRILLAATLGPFIAMDPALSLSGWLGVFLIFSANVYLTVRKAKH